MNATTQLVVRNIKVYLRDPSGVFFSLLSPLIMIMLYVLFLGNLQTTALSSQLPHAQAHDIQWFVDSWVFAGIVMIATVTTPLGVISAFVDDRASGRFNDFVVAPVRKVSLILGYMLASFAITVVLAVVIIILSQFYGLIRGYPLLSAGDVARLGGCVVVSSAAFSALISFIVTFAKTTGAFSTLSTIIGTLIGFLAGAYLPPGLLPQAVVNAMNVMPFAQSAMLFRIPFTADALSKIGGARVEAMTPIREYYGISLMVGDTHLHAWLVVVVLLVVCVVFSALGAWRLARIIR